ncbi:cullin-9 isoform X1 [Hoplias malabaricus]|uniref:cullin-9 isoform X1 n=1 Tax=Hoplias malabaricus TaxID=27720 RepID=UPI0034629808
MEKISTVFKKTQNVLRTKMKNKHTGHRRDLNSPTQSLENKTGPRSGCVEPIEPAVHPQSPCGHVVKASCLVNMVNQCLKRKSLDFSCPICEENWSWSQVRGQLLLSQAQTVVLDAQVSRILQDLPDVYKKCPVCSSIICRPMDSAGRPCPFSSCKLCPQIHHFCWSCLAPWVFPHAASSGQCSNRSCHIVSTLLACEAVTEAGSLVMGCPVFRACPQCYTLTTPQPDSKYVVCIECNHRFCYICLDSETQCAKGEDLCHSQNCKKPRAERQKFIT